MVFPNIFGAGGAAWGLLGDSDDGGGDGGSQGGGSDGGKTAGQDTGGTGGGNGSAGQDTGGGSDGGGGNGGGDDGGGGNGSTTITVHVTVTAIRDSYAGSCPPPEGLAPSFRGTISVSDAPAEVSYRWLTASGEGGSDWRTASFGNSLEQNVDYSVLAYNEGGTYQDSIGIEVQSPQQSQSDKVYFSTTCEGPAPEPEPEPEPEQADSYSPG